MSYSRAKKLETNQVIKLVKDLNKKMESFEDSVQELKMLKESLVEMNDQVVEQETVNKEALRQLKEDLKENKLKILTETAQSMGRVIISEEELHDHEEEVKKWKDECLKVKASVQAEIRAKVDEQIERQMKILELQNENRNAKLLSSCENYQSEIANLKAVIERMSSELESQKRLTADIANVRSRKEENSK